MANITTAITKASEEMFDIRDKDGTLRGGSLKPNQENESPNKREEFLEHWSVRELTQEKSSSQFNLGQKFAQKTQFVRRQMNFFS